MAAVNGEHDISSKRDSGIGVEKTINGSWKTSEASTDDYVLTRDVGASARLNLSHYIWKDAFGYNLHPRIAESIAGNERVRVADIGTGTGIWLLDLARMFPRTAVLDGIDISHNQCPPTAWLPSNVTLRNIDLFGTVPDELVNYYDFVHIRHFVCVVRSNDPNPVLRNLLRMLKPGGWIQWDEWDVGNRYLTRITPDAPHEMIDKLEQELKGMRKHTAVPSWPPRLDDYFLLQSMQHVAMEKRLSDLSHLPFMHDLSMLVFKELIDLAEANESIDAEETKQLRQLLAAAIKESRFGAAWNLTRCMAIGQKKLF